LSRRMSASVSISTCAGVRGKPSKMYPLRMQSSSAMRFLAKVTMNSSGTVLDPSRYSFALIPISVGLSYAASRSREPVDMTGTSYCLLSMNDNVVLPLSAAPRMLTLSGRCAYWRSDGSHSGWPKPHTALMGTVEGETVYRCSLSLT
jgi:hypothetical protein